MQTYTKRTFSMTQRFSLMALSSLLLLTLIAACSSSNGSAPATTSVSGYLLAGPITGASLTVKDQTGTTVAGPITVNSADGSYTIAIPNSALSGPLVFQATGGTFPDEASGSTGVAAGTLSSYVPAGSIASGANITLDASSTIVQKLVAGGMAKVAADAAFAAAFGYTPDVTVKPAFATISSASTSSQRLVGLRAAAFSQLTTDLGLSPAQQFELIQALADDLSDGVLDGKKAGTPVTTASQFAIPTDIAGKFAKSFAGFLTGTQNKSKQTAAPFNTVYYTPTYKVEYLPGMMAAAQGKTTFKVRLTNRGDGTAATGKSISLLPKMYMAGMSHSCPVDAVVESSTPRAIHSGG
jgi:hypothetical protein